MFGLVRGSSRRVFAAASKRPCAHAATAPSYASPHAYPYAHHAHRPAAAAAAVAPFSTVSGSASSSALPPVSPLPDILTAPLSSEATSPFIRESTEGEIPRRTIDYVAMSAARAKIEPSHLQYRMSAQEARRAQQVLFYSLARTSQESVANEIRELVGPEAALPDVPARPQYQRPGSDLMGPPRTLYVRRHLDSHLELMAAYHVWATQIMLKEVEHLTDEEFGRDIGLHFGSIHATLAHMHAADRLWLDRLKGGDVKWAEPLWADSANRSTLEQFMPDRATLVKQIVETGAVRDTHRHTSTSMCD